VALAALGVAAANYLDRTPNDFKSMGVFQFPASPGFINDN
jgi:hypothetical protein